MSPYSGTVLLGAMDPDPTVTWVCPHQHRTAKEARACGDAEAERQKRTRSTPGDTEEKP